MNDFIVTAPCGCRVTYTAESNYRTGTAEWLCEGHDPKRFKAAQDDVIAAADRKRDQEKGDKHWQ